MDPIIQSRLIEFAEAAIEGRILPEQEAQLEHWVLSDPKAASLYAQYMSMHASLRVTQSDSVQLNRSIPRFDLESRNPFRETKRSIHQKQSVSWIAVAVAGLLLVSLLIGGGLSGFYQARSIATITETKGCKWDAGSLPTEVGAKLTAGRLRLAEGLATIRFGNGVEVKLESPADIELISMMKCVMHSGQLIANVPPNAKGFQVETSSSIITDFGTEFGVSIGKDESAVVQVFEGRVDTYHRSSKKVETMHAGRSMQFNPGSYSDHRNAEQSVLTANSSSMTALRERWHQITTGQGQGKDAFVQAMEIPSDRQSDTLLLVKRPIERMATWERRVYLGFDLSEVHGKSLSKAELNLTFAPTGFGFASLTPDANFQVYGLINEELDNWSDLDLVWENAPACGEPRKPLDSRQVIPLGSFVIPQGEQSTSLSFSGNALVQFLAADTNRIATLIILRETEGSGSSDLVHGIVSRRHPSLQPPTLRILMTEE